MKRFSRRLNALMRRRRLDRDLEDELQFHLEMLGQQPAARRQFGNLTALKEACRERWTFNALEALGQDVRFAFRTLVKNPVYAAVAIAALALGIGANATVFTIINAILLKNLPFPDSERIAYLRGRGISYPDFLDLRAAASFDGLGAADRSECNLSDRNGPPQHYFCPMMTTNAFSVIRIQPVIGRAFQPEDERPGSPPVAVLSYLVWESRYGADPSVIGTSVRLDSVPTTIIGVMPRGIRFPTESDLWRPLVPGAARWRRDNRDLTVFGRLAPHATKSSAQAEMSTFAKRLASQYPETNDKTVFRVESFNRVAIPTKLVPVFYLLSGAVAFVLLIACANVANLMLSRAVTRTREISIRAAIGASRWRVIRQLLVESLVLSFFGGLLGWLLAIWGSRAFDAAITPTGRPAWIDFSEDYRVLLYLTAICVASGILFGLAPALRLARLDLNAVLKDGGRAAGVGTRARHLSSVLVVTEVTLAVVLLTGSGLMIRSLLQAYTTSPGVDDAKVLTMRVDLPAARYPLASDRWAFWSRLHRELSALPGVETATVATAVTGPNRGIEFEVESTSAAGARKRRSFDTAWVGPDYFRTMGITIREGREFQPVDDAGTSAAVVINHALAAAVWPGENAIGKRLRAMESGVPQAWLTVVGVAPDIFQAVTDPALHSPVVYQYWKQAWPKAPFYVAARTQVPPSSLGNAFRGAVQAVDQDQPVSELDTLRHVVEMRTWLMRIFGTMFAIFAGIAFALASVGLYAVVSHSVSQRTHEIGVRVAMGASSAGVLRLVFAEGLRRLAIGLVLGFGISLGVARLLGNLVVGVSPSDPLTFASVAAALLASGFAGCALPARRALRVDPVVTLRCD